MVVALCLYSSLILRPSNFDCLQYAKTGGVEGLGTKVSIFQVHVYTIYYKQSSCVQNNVIITFWSYAWDTSATSLVDVVNHCNTTAFVFVNCITHKHYESHSYWKDASYCWETFIVPDNFSVPTLNKRLLLAIGEIEQWLPLKALQ